MKKGLVALFFILSLTVSISSVANSTGSYTNPRDAPWVDPNQVEGKLWFAHELYAGKGIQCEGTVVDPCDQPYRWPVTLTLTGVPGTTTVDPNNHWNWLWRTKVSDAGKVFHAVLTATAIDPIYGQPAMYQGTVAIRVLPPFVPPVIKPTGCRTVD